MNQIFEIVMRNKNPEASIVRLTVRVVGLQRNDAVLLAEETYKEFSVYYVMAGPRLDE